MDITKERFLEVCADLESGKIRVAEKIDGQWVVNSWIKETILAGFRLGALADMSEGGKSVKNIENGGSGRWIADKNDYLAGCIENTSNTQEY